jgi:transcriptional regulator with XRE-family HTH domain
MSKAKLSLPDYLREAIRASGMSLTRLGRLSHVDSGRLSRFMRGERDLTLEATNQICEALGLDFTCGRQNSKAAEKVETVTRPRRPRKK